MQTTRTRHCPTPQHRCYQTTPRLGSKHTILYYVPPCLAIYRLPPAVQVSPGTHLSSPPGFLPISTFSSVLKPFDFEASVPSAFILLTTSAHTFRTWSGVQPSCSVSGLIHSASMLSNWVTRNKLPKLRSCLFPGHVPNGIFLVETATSVKPASANIRGSRCVGSR